MLSHLSQVWKRFKLVIAPRNAATIYPHTYRANISPVGPIAIAKVVRHAMFNFTSKIAIWYKIDNLRKMTAAS